MLTLSALEKLWPACPTEVCKIVMPYMYLVPAKTLLEVPITQHIQDVHILDKDTIVTSSQSLGYASQPTDYHIHTTRAKHPIKKALPNGDLIYVHSGALFIRDGTLLHIVDQINGQRRVATYKFEHPVERIHVSGKFINAYSQTISYQLPVVCKQQHTAIYNQLELGECIYYAPWSHCSIVGDRMAYMSVKIIDGVPQKTAVLAAL